MTKEQFEVLRFKTSAQLLAGLLAHGEADGADAQVLCEIATEHMEELFKWFNLPYEDDEDMVYSLPQEN